ncbi:glycosyltransferase family 2 protein [Cellulosilyticum sp. I15G10I2]|uniref:glycosyltransferase family 2 protein n=1 Tax=Cellulosilyticum sp. I15G10I2 TaxID=1892843 RepID=UPI00085BD521|nr:glycosyltransferase [Cellulosilyticum sp. I15G10I2]
MMDHKSLITSEVHTPLVSIVVLAYNHLNYTKMCIESLYKYTSDVNFELITINNGSTDGTEAYFESLTHTKKISFPENIGVDKAINYGFKIAEGKYTLNLSNDIVVTSNWLSNLITCMESDVKVGMVVPVCGASSNNQQVVLPYNSLDEMQHMARKYNKSNPNLWEERLKLVTYTCLFRTDLQKAIGGFDEAFNPGAYDDDAISFRIRRAGYKLILAMDTYVHHFGSVTFNAEYTKNNLAARNNELFKKKFGLYSWNACMIDFNIVNIADYTKGGSVRILGIGKSCASTLLQMKNIFRKNGVWDTELFYLSEAEQSMTDLYTICRECIYASAQNVKQYFGSRQYDVIVVESETNKLDDLEQFFIDLADMVKDDGQIITTALGEVYPKINNILLEKGFIHSNQVRNYYFAFTAQQSQEELSNK